MTGQLSTNGSTGSSPSLMVKNTKANVGERAGGQPMSQSPLKRFWKLKKRDGSLSRRGTGIAQHGAWQAFHALLLFLIGHCYYLPSYIRQAGVILID
jgi:hypothetical protein